MLYSIIFLKQSKLRNCSRNLFLLLRLRTYDLYIRAALRRFCTARWRSRSRSSGRRRIQTSFIGLTAHEKPIESGFVNTSAEKNARSLTARCCPCVQATCNRVRRPSTAIQSSTETSCRFRCSTAESSASIKTAA